MSLPYEPAAIPSNEAERILALRNYEILDTPNQAVFDDYTWLASHICQTPIALISLVDHQRQWFKSRVGLKAQETSRDTSFCAHAILQNQVFEIPDTLEDKRFKHNPLVEGDPFIRFYAGAPLTSAEGYHIGTLCVIDQKPKQLSEEQKNALQRLSRQVIQQMEVQQLLKERRREEALMGHISEVLTALAAGNIPPDLLQDLTQKMGEILPDIFLAVHFRDHLGQDHMKGYGTPYHSLSFYEKQIAHFIETYTPNKAPNRIRYEPAYSPVLLHIGENIVGGISLAATSQRHLEKSERFLKPLLNSISSLLMSYRKALSQQQTYQNQRLQLQALQSLNDIASLPELDLKAQIQKSLILGCQYFDVELGLIVENTPQKKVFAAYTQTEIALDPEAASLPPECLNIPQDFTPYFSPIKEGLHLAVPLEIDNQVLGALHFLCPPTTPHALTDTDTEFLRLFSRWIASTWSRYIHQQQGQKNEELLEKAGKIAQVGGWEVDLKTGTPIWSAQTRAIHEVPDDFVPDMDTAINFYTPESRPVIKALIEDAIEKGSTWDVEMPLVTAKNKLIWVRSAGETIVENGKTVRLFGVFQDITRRKNNERIKEAFISTMNHELRTPLTSIAGALSMLRNPKIPSTPETTQKLFDIATKNTARLTELINDLLDIEKIAAGAMRFQPRILEATQLIEEAIHQLSPFAAEYNSSYQFKIPEGTQHYIQVDPLRFNQVLNNLLSNAAKFSPHHSTITITLSQHKQGAKSEICITVNNPGPGIPEKFHEQVFKRFMQVDNTDSRSQGGTGLGLAISKELTEAMGGTISFTSNAENTRFSIHFPEVNAPESYTTHRLTQGKHPQYKTRILFIEDDTDLAQVVSEQCQDLAHFSFASTLQDAQQHLKESVYDLILLDLMLPDGSGFKLLPEIRRLNPSPEVVVLSAIELNTAQRSLVNEALVKSRFTPEAFVTWLHDKLAQHQEKGN